MYIKEKWQPPRRSKKQIEVIMSKILPAKSKYTQLEEDTLSELYNDRSPSGRKIYKNYLKELENKYARKD